MAAPAILPRLVIRGDTALSWDGPVPAQETVEALDRGLRDFGRLLIWDIEGIERNRPNLNLLRRFEGESLWVDAGIRFADSVVDVLVAGAERVVLGTKTLRGPEELEEARELTENLVPLLDFVRGRPWASEWMSEIPPGQLLARWREAGLDTALVLDEEGAFPRSVLEQSPDGLALFAGIVRKKDAGSLPAGKGAIVDFWEVVPRKT